MKPSWTYVFVLIGVIIVLSATIIFLFVQDAKKDGDEMNPWVVPPTQYIENGKGSVGGGETATSFSPFYVYKDKPSRLNHFVASGFMPDGKCIIYNDVWGEGCHEGKSCIRVAYDLTCSRAGQRWAGIYWLNPANNWGKRKGGFDLTGANRLTFWAKGENGGEQIQEFTVGGISGDYPDSDIATIGPVILSDEWRQYSIDLKGKDLSYISGGFSWSTSEEVNFDSCVFYLDEIRYE